VLYKVTLCIFVVIHQTVVSDGRSDNALTTSLIESRVWPAGQTIISQVNGPQDLPPLWANTFVQSANNQPSASVQTQATNTFNNNNNNNQFNVNGDTFQVCIYKHYTPLICILISASLTKR
jgi:hypothetical protein